MNSRDKDGYAASDWVGFAIFEARDDAIGLWRIIKAGRENFCISGLALEQFVDLLVFELLQAGAAPVFGYVLPNGQSGWRAAASHGAAPRILASSIVQEWKESSCDPGLDGLWFTFSFELPDQPNPSFQRTASPPLN